MFSILIGFAAGVASTLAVGALFAFGPKRLQNGAAAVVRVLLWYTIPFVLVRQSYLGISSSQVELHGDKVYVVRIDDRHELVSRKRDTRYSFSLWHLVPAGLVIALTVPLARFTARTELSYGDKSAGLVGTVLKIDRHVSIFTLTATSLAERRARWGR